METRIPKRIISTIAGIGTFALLQLLLAILWSRFFARNGATSPWFLNSVPGLTASCTFVVLAVLALGLWARSTRWADIGWFILGIAVAMACTLAILGETSLWPISLIVGMVTLTASTVVGAGLAAVLRGKAS